MGSITPPYESNGFNGVHEFNDVNGTRGFEDGHHQDGARLRISGIGVEYPPYQFDAQALDTLAARFYPSSPAYSLHPSTLIATSVSKVLLKSLPYL